MDKKMAGLVAAFSALAPIGATDLAAAKSVAEVLTPTSYAELLQPIPNAVALLQAADQAELAGLAKAASGPSSKTEVAQYWYHHHHHHHHHHNNYWRRRYHHHHNNYWRQYHHHHHNYYPGYYNPY